MPGWRVFSPAPLRQVLPLRLVRPQWRVRMVFLGLMGCLVSGC